VCHLTGYIGNDNCIPILLKSLETQEGIIGGQATGIATMSNDRISMTKNVGPVRDFKEKYQMDDSSLGIGHTRYAIKNVKLAETNTKEKAHPFWNSDKSFITMHNGTLYKFEDHVKELEKKGYNFRSKSTFIDKTTQKKVTDYCDSEIFSYLLEEELKLSDDIEECIRNACKNLYGHFAFVVLHPRYPDKIFLANWMQPMFVGTSEDFAYFSSFKEGFQHLVDTVSEINEPSKNTLLTFQKGKIITEKLLSERKTPDYFADPDIWHPAIKKAINDNYNDLASIWTYTYTYPDIVKLTKEEYDELIRNGYTFSPIVYSMLQEMIISNEIYQKLEYVWEGGIESTPRYKFYLKKK
jgi:glucosamine 6-phosphate synthetase-like amidotransferase/phosphosugar isomerase protein